MKNKTKKQKKFEKSIKLKNKKLLKEYPFLQPIDWFGRKISSRYHKYEFTALDDLPKGWRKAFSKQMLEDIKKELIENNFLHKYIIFQIKEKYGGLRWYDNFNLKCIDKYEDLSYYTCIRCGKPATLISKGWISPWCDTCSKDINTTFIPINEFYTMEEE